MTSRTLAGTTQVMRIRWHGPIYRVMPASLSLMCTCLSADPNLTYAKNLVQTMGLGEHHLLHSLGCPASVLVKFKAYAPAGGQSIPRGSCHAQARPSQLRCRSSALLAMVTLTAT